MAVGDFAEISLCKCSSLCDDCLHPTISIRIFPTVHVFILVFSYSGFGLPALLETEWSKLHIPVVLRVFWILRLLDHTTNYIMQHDIAKNATMPFNFNETTLFNDYSEHIVVFLPALMQMVKSLLISGCETFIAVLGMTSVISYICQQIGYFFQYVS